MRGFHLGKTRFKMSNNQRSLSLCLPSIVLQRLRLAYNMTVVKKHFLRQAWEMQGAGDSSKVVAHTP